MKAHLGFRWLTVRAWQRVGWSSPGAIALQLIEMVALVVVIVVLRDAWWVGLVPLSFFAADYVVRSHLAFRTLGPSAHARSPFRWVSFIEWRSRWRERGGVYLLGFAFAPLWMSTGSSDGALLVGLLANIGGWIAVVAGADYLWCCASRGGWLASRPSPPPPQDPTTPSGHPA